MSAAAHTEIACERARTVWVPAASMATEVGKIAAAPMPASTCAVSRTAIRALWEVPGPGVKKPSNSAESHQRGTGRKQPFAAEQVAHHAEAELEAA